MEALGRRLGCLPLEPALSMTLNTVTSSSVMLYKNNTKLGYSSPQKLAPFTLSSKQALSHNHGVNSHKTNTSLSCTSAKAFTCQAQTNSSGAPISDKVQELCIYEINERDRGSPKYLRLSYNKVNSIGDLVPFTNSVYTGDLKKRLGISSGLCVFIKNEPELKGDRYEAAFSFYFGKYGHISCQGTYCTYPMITYPAVTGGSGIFQGVSGQVKLHLLYPRKIRYTFSLKGIPELPAELIVPTFFPTCEAELEASPAAKNLEPEGVIEGYQN